jgi:hypothetical protein
VLADFALDEDAANIRDGKYHETKIKVDPLPGMPKLSARQGRLLRPRAPNPGGAAYRTASAW